MEIAHVRVAGQSVRVTHFKPLVALTQGARVVFDFDETWEAMTRTLVWRAGDITVDDATGSGIIPAALLEKSGCDLFVGVYGTGENKAVPTLWAHLGYIHPGADPSGDPAADPGLPLWAQVADKAQAALDTAHDALRAAAETETFTAQYGTTEHGEILEAYRAGKVCVCADDNSVYLLSQVDEEKAVFTGWDEHGLYYRYTCTAPKSWELEYDAYFKTKGISATSTDDQIPTAAAVYKAMVNAGSEPEIYIGYEEQTTWGELSRQVGYGKLVFVQENKVTQRLHQYYGHDDGSGVMRFYRVDGDGIHWLAVDRENVWSSGDTEFTQEVFRAFYDATTYDEIQAAADGGKFCFLQSGSLYMPLVYAYNGQAVFSAYHPVSGMMESATVTADGWSNDRVHMRITEVVDENATNFKIPTAKAVWDAVSGKVGQDALEEAVNDALTQAKESGAFDGEEGGYYTPELVDIGGGSVHVGFVKSKESMPDGPSMAISAPEGPPGKSAYAYAQEAGYGGTEEEFGEKLAQDAELFLVTIANKPGAITADKTYAEIRAADQAGKTVVLRYANFLHFLSSNDPASITFYPMVTAVIAPAANRKWKVTSADVWSYEYADIPFATTEVTADSTDGALPTAKAVHTAIRAANNRKYQLIRSLEVTEPVNNIEFTDLNLDELTLFMQAPKVETAIGHDIFVYNTEGTAVFYHWPGGTIHTDYPRNCCWHVNRNKGYVEGFFSIQTIASNSHLLSPKPCQMTHSFVDGSLPFDTIKMRTYSDTLLFPVGLKIEVWGLAADE